MVGIAGAAFRSPPGGQSAVVALMCRNRFARHICCCRRWGRLAEVLGLCSGSALFGRKSLELIAVPHRAERSRKVSRTLCEMSLT